MAERDHFLDGLEGKIGRTTAKKGRLYFEVADKDLHDVVRHLFLTKGCRLSTATAMEMYRGLEVLYQFPPAARGGIHEPAPHPRRAVPSPARGGRVFQAPRGRRDGHRHRHRHRLHAPGP